VRIQTITIYCPSSYRWSVQQQSVIEALTIACADIDYLVRFVTNVRQEKFSVKKVLHQNMLKQLSALFAFVIR
jgi:hypothetical protein